MSADPLGARLDTFVSLADGKLNGQKAFMTGALKVKGNVSDDPRRKRTLKLTTWLGHDGGVYNVDPAIGKSR